MNITAITCTGDRPEAFRLCEKYIKRQSVQPFQALVLDDGVIPTKPTLGQEYFYWPEFAGRQSLSRKISRAMVDGLVKGDAIIFFEDDDFYAPDYIEWSIEGLKQWSIFGEGRAVYYNVVHRWTFEHTNLSHASLCATSVAKAAFPFLEKQAAISDCPFLDVRLWNKPPVSNRVADPFKNGFRRSVGIKGMPGRGGYGGGHRGRDRSAILDLSLTRLRALIGADADLYSKFYDATKAPLPREHNGFVVSNTGISKPPSPATKKTMNNIARSEAGRVHGPNWLEWLGHLAGQPDIVGGEIGTFEGDSAEWFLENIFTHETSRYICIDPFTGSVEHKVGGFNVSMLEETTRVKLSRFKNVEIHKGYSQDVLRALTVKADAIYVDGDHTTRASLRDGVLAFELLKVGGVMIFDDLNWAVFPNELDRPKTGIEAFVKCYKRQLQVLSQPNAWQLAVKKIAE